MLIKQKLPDFNAPVGAGNTISVRIPTSSPALLCGIVLVGTGTSGATPAELDLSSVIKEVRIMQDQFCKARFKPTLQRKLDSILNSTSDTLSISCMAIPFFRMNVPGSKWGLGDIGQLTLEVEFVNPFPANTVFAGSALKAYWGYNPIVTPQPRGDVFVQTVINVPNPIAGWNRINDLPYQGIVSLTKMLLDNPAITEVKVSLGTREVYNATKKVALFAMENNQLYKVPSTITAPNTAAPTASIGPFPVILDDLGDPGDFMPLFINGVRQEVIVEFFWDTAINAVAAFDILAEGIERGVQSNAPVAAGRA
jgi:hypothetical protein